MRTVTLRNGITLPAMCIGTNRMDEEKLTSIISEAFDSGLCFFDSARDYGNEDIVGKVIENVAKEKCKKREEFFITTKVGNGQQTSLNMESQIDLSLKNLRTDYIDVWLLHWPLPDYYIENFSQMEKILSSGKVKAVGIANVQLRHLLKLREQVNGLPLIIQIEHHPLRYSKDVLNFCAENQILVEAYSPLCFMIDKLKNNPVLLEISKRYGKSLGQIVLRWHIQHGILPVFRTENPKRFAENTDIFDFALSDDDMNRIFALDEDFKFIPESLHCPGY